MIQEHDRVVLTVDQSDYGLFTGDVGRIVHIYADGEAYEVEFFRMDGRTLAVITVAAAAVRGIKQTDILHVRQRA